MPIRYNPPTEPRGSEKALEATEVGSLDNTSDPPSSRVCRRKISVFKVASRLQPYQAYSKADGVS